MARVSDAKLLTRAVGARFAREGLDAVCLIYRAAQFAGKPRSNAEVMTSTQEKPLQ
jgi:hypothetical protein